MKMAHVVRGVRRLLRAALPLLVVLALATFTRLYGLEYAHFQADQASFTRLAAGLAEGREFPMAGTPATAGWLHPPLAVYLFALAYRLVADPLALTAFVALANVAAVGLTYWVARMVGGTAAGLLAAGLLALLPGAIHFGRFIWNPNLVVALASLSLGGLLAHRRGRRWGVPVAAFGLLWAVQLHPFTALELPALLLGWWMGGWRTSWRGLALAAVAGALPLVPYVYRFVVDRPPLPGGSVGPVLSARAFLEAVALVNPVGYSSFLGIPGLPSASAPGVLSVALLALVAVWLALWAALARDGRRGEGGPVEWRDWLPSAVWAVAPPALASLRLVSPLPHYFLATLPGICLVLGLLLSRAWVGLRGERRVFLGAVGLVAMLGCVYALSFLSYVEATQRNEVGPAYGAGLAYSRQAIAELARLEEAAETANGSLTAALAQRERGDGGSLERGGSEQGLEKPRRVYLAAPERMGEALEMLLGGRRVVRFWGERSLVLPPAGQSAVYLVTEDGGEAARLLRELFADSVAGLIGPPTRPAYSLYHLPANGAERLAALPWRELQHGLGGAALYDGYLLPGGAKAGEELTVALRWSVAGSGASLPGRLSTFGVLVDHRGQPWGDEDHPHYPRGRWLVGERVVDWYRIPVNAAAPSGRYWVESGVYRPETLERLTLDDGSGRPAGTAMRLGPLRVVRPAAGRAAAEPERSVSATWEEGIVLEGFDLPEAPPGGPVALRLYWRAVQVPRGSYTLFVHLVDGSGRLVGQSDGLPREGALPTDFWLPREQVVEERIVQPAAPLPPGEYRVLVGWYHAETGGRLRLVGEPGGDAFELTRIQVP